MGKPVLQQVDAQVQVQVNRALATGGLVAALLGGVGVVGATAALGVTGDTFFVPPALFAAAAALMALGIRALARRDRMRGWIAVSIMLGFVSLPTGFFLSGYLFSSGAATFLTGPISYLYAFLIVISGFLFDPRVSIAAGILAALEYLAVFALARETLVAVQTPHRLLHEDLSGWFLWVNKGVMFVAVGFATAGSAVIARRLLVQTLQEARLFGQYVSPEIREKIVAGASGERVEAVVLFSDLCGFSTYSESRQPEEIVAQLNEYFDRMVASIQAQGGLVDKFIGDAIMAVFEAGPTTPEPARAAVAAARSMRSELDELNGLWAAAGTATFDNGIGIHVGEVVQGPIGSVDRKEWTVIGDAVNSAARLESLTRRYEHCIIVTDSVYERLSAEERDGFSSLGETTVKGKQEPLRVYGTRG